MKANSRSISPARIGSSKHCSRRMNPSHATFTLRATPLRFDKFPRYDRYGGYNLTVASFAVAMEDIYGRELVEEILFSIHIDWHIGGSGSKPNASEKSPSFVRYSLRLNVAWMRH